MPLLPDTEHGNVLQLLVNGKVVREWPITGDQPGRGGVTYGSAVRSRDAAEAALQAFNEKIGPPFPDQAA